MPNPRYSPIKLAPVSKAKIWGGDKLQRLVPGLGPSEQPIGEVWSVWDGCLVAEGEQRGATLAELARRDAVGFLGSRVAAQHRDAFPLLVKFIDARDVLSLQVHPDDSYAREREKQPFGKSEVWYVVSAEAGSRVIHGFRRNLRAAEFREALDARQLADDLQFVEVLPGDVVLNLPGTVHALGAGAVIYELQQSADITYRLYDWDRVGDDGQPRELHLERGLEVASLGPCSLDKLPALSAPLGDQDRTFLCATEHFAAELLNLRGSSALSTGGACFHILTAIRGAARVRCGAGTVGLSAGESLVVPAGVGDYAVEAIDEPCEVIKACVPDLLEDVVRPLARSGVSAERILALGGGADNRELRECLASVGADLTR